MLKVDREMDMEEQGPSKTQRKQAMNALQKLGVEIVALNKSQIDQLKLPEQLLDAVLEAKRLTQHEAIRRQMQYIGKIMRGVDPAPIQQQLDAWNGVSQQATAHMHLLERWRERLLAEDDALGEFISAHPGCDAQQLRTLIRNTRKEQAANRAPASYRALFRWLRDTLQAPSDDVVS
jgi:ribosome-associated protein